MEESTHRRNRISNSLETHFYACEQVANDAIGRISDDQGRICPSAVQEVIALTRVLSQLGLVIGRLEAQQRGASRAARSEDREIRNSIPQ
jgi:hypothetical protein